MKHVAKDEAVGLEFMLKNQKRLNGHISMILKTFNVGAAWNHQARIRATKLTHSLSIAPVYLLYKDHKGWAVETGGVPPSRPQLVEDKMTICQRQSARSWNQWPILVQEGWRQPVHRTSQAR